jgi:predicted RNA-binding protein with PUA-like domain
VGVALWLFKEEPEHYSFADLQRDGRATWDGVTNALARQHLRRVQPGDRVFFYHTGKEKAVVGEMRVLAGPRPDPADEDPKAVIVEVAPVKALGRPVTLAEIKNDPLLADWELVRLPRLSVMPVSEEQWRRVEELGRPGGPAKLGKTAGET